MNTAPETSLPHVVVIGGGFAGLAAARALKGKPVRVTLIDRTNHHLFQPLLYQVATAKLAPSDIAIPIRYILRNQKNATVLMATVTHIDLASRTVHFEDGRLSFDYLVLATGARHSYFGNDAYEPLAPGLKTLGDGLEMRRRLLSAYEKAELETSFQKQTELLTFVVVGGGPTGVELAGMIPELTRIARKEFRRANAGNTRVILVEAGPRILPSMPESLSEKARHDLASLGVEVLVDAPVSRVDEKGVVAGSIPIATRTIFWAAGNAASPLGNAVSEQAGLASDRGGRVPVMPDLSVPGYPNVFVLGDLASVYQGGRQVPAVAPAAMQQGRAAGRNILASISGHPRRSFRYVDKGNLATIGRRRAVAAFFNDRLRFSGVVAWWLWLLVHLMYLVGFRNRLSVLLQWGYAYLTGRRGVHLIVDKSRSTRPVAQAAAGGHKDADPPLVVVE